MLPKISNASCRLLFPLHSRIFHQSRRLHSFSNHPLLHIYTSLVTRHRPWRQRNRGKKTISSVRLEDLPRTFNSLEPLSRESAATENDKTKKDGARYLPQGLISDRQEEDVVPPIKIKKPPKVLVRDQDIPQGLIPLEPLAFEDDIPAYPPLISQARSNMQKFQNCVLLTRVGGFYELYFEHAEEYGPLLNLKVTQRNLNANRPNTTPVSMVTSLFSI